MRSVREKLFAWFMMFGLFIVSPLAHATLDGNFSGTTNSRLAYGTPTFGPSAFKRTTISLQASAGIATITMTSSDISYTGSGAVSGGPTTFSISVSGTFSCYRHAY